MLWFIVGRNSFQFIFRTSRSHTMKGFVSRVVEPTRLVRIRNLCLIKVKIKPYKAYFHLLFHIVILNN